MEPYQKADKLLLGRNYQKIEETNGNRTIRILLGAFVKYFKFHVLVNEIDKASLKLRIVRATSGMSGVIIGINQVTKKMTELSMLL